MSWRGVARNHVLKRSSGLPVAFSVPIPAAALAMLGAASVLAILVAIPGILLTTSASSIPPGWAQETIGFYQDATRTLLEQALRDKVTRIQLHPEEDQSGLLCASPCNRDLARLIRKALTDNGRPDVEVVYHEQPVPSSWFSDQLIALCSWMGKRLPWLGIGTFGSGWHRLSGENQSPEPVEVLDPQPTLHGKIRIHRVAVWMREGKFEAQFELGVGQNEAAIEPRVARSCHGGTRQIRWFVRERCPLWAGLANVSLIAVSLFSATRVACFGMGRDRAAPPASRIAVVCSFIGSTFLFVFLFVSPMIRRDAVVHKQTNLYYVCDQNSEIWLSPVPEGLTAPSDGKEGIPYLARSLEKRIGDIMLEIAPGRIKGFFRWLSDGDWLPAIYDPKRYSLNPPFATKVYGFSGHPEAEWGEGLETLPAAAWPREARLLCPHRELASLVRPPNASQVEDWPKSFVLLLTSACAPCRAHEKLFLEWVDGIEDRLRENLSVFSVLVPSLPKTGADNLLFDYEEGKAALLALVSDRIVFLNDVAGRLDSIAEHIQALDKQLSNPPKKTLPEQVITEIPPLFQLSNLDYAHRDAWGAPGNLDQARWERLRTNPGVIDRVCESIVEHFAQFVRSQGARKSEFSIQVIGPDPLLWVLGVLAVIPGCSVFWKQCNSAYLGRFENSWAVWCLHYAIPPIILLAMVLYLGWLTWEVENPEVWARQGDPQWALLIGLTWWVSWAVVPLVAFAARRKGLEGLSEESAVYCASVISLGIVGLWWLLDHLLHRFSGAAWLWKWRFWSTLGLPLAVWVAGPLLIGWTWLLVRAVRQARTNRTGQFPSFEPNHLFGPTPGTGWEWWQQPIPSGLVKGAVILLVVFLSQSAFPAGSRLGTRWEQFTLFCSHRGAVALAAALLSLLGCCVAWSQQYWRYRAAPLGVLVLSLLLFSLPWLGG